MKKNKCKICGSTKNVVITLCSPKCGLFAKYSFYENGKLKLSKAGLKHLKRLLPTQ